MTDAGTKPKFVYVTYIRTTPEKLWRALIDPEFTRQYWVETWQECDWKAGAPWKLMIPDGRVGDSGEVLEIEPARGGWCCRGATSSSRSCTRKATRG